MQPSFVRPGPRRACVAAGAGLALRLGALLFTPSVQACGDTIELPADQRGTPALVGFDAGPVPSGPPPSRSCETLLPSYACGSAEVNECPDPGPQLSTRIDALDCDLSLGLRGDPMHLHTDCEVALLAGQSGDGCGASFVCARLGSVPCCIELASCSDSGESLLRTRACAQFCPPPPLPSPPALIGSCADLASRAAAGGEGQLLGLPCRNTSLLCGPEFEDLAADSIAWADSLRLYTCAANLIQLFTTLPNYPVPVEADGSAPEPNSIATHAD